VDGARDALRVDDVWWGVLAAVRVIPPDRTGRAGAARMPRGAAYFGLVWGGASHRTRRAAAPALRQPSTHGEALPLVEKMELCWAGDCHANEAAAGLMSMSDRTEAPTVKGDSLY